MQQGDTSNSYYQFYQSHFHNANPNPNPNSNPNAMDPHMSPWPAVPASAPPVSSSDYPNYSHSYPSFPQNSNTTALTYSENPNTQFPPPSHYLYDQNQPSYYPHDRNYTASNPIPYGSNGDGVKYDHSDCYGDEDGVYRYEGGMVEPYGARGTARYARSSSSQVMFDDYGRPINVSNGNQNGNGYDQGGSKASKVVKAIPKTDTEEDVKSGVLKFRLKLLADSYGQSDMDVLCQIGLDGIQMLDPATSRTLKIYPLEKVTRWEVLDSHIFAFWAETSVDAEPKRLRLKSNSYTTTTILDAVTAASVQLKEIGGIRDPNSSKSSDQHIERKKGFADWMNLIKPPNEEKEHWVPDEAVNNCTSCGTNFNAFVRKHHCRNCGDIFCDKCTQGRTPLTMDEQAPTVRVCDRCLGEVTQRLANAREAANRSGSLLSHEDLAKKLKEEMKKNVKPSSGLKTEESQTQMREVECPTCTVHLQVEVPTSGSETIECSVCQHPFLVSAY